MLHNAALILSRQHYTGKNLKQCCTRGSRQQCTGKILFNVVIILLRQHCTWKKTLCNVVQEARDNITHEKILFNIVVILLGQHCKDKNPAQYCPRDYRQHYTGKNTVHCRLNNITFSIFYFGLVIFLIKTGCCKCRTNITQISLTLHKKNLRPTLNKKTRLWGARTYFQFYLKKVFLSSIQTFF